jgi:6-pyruvoyltetrahydropterin/6-carboxytetrahydropterin synthase
MKTTITKEFKWEAAHRLWNPDLTEEENEGVYGSCFNLHGHSYKMFVTVSSDKLENGMIMNFKDLKEVIQPIIDYQDHTLNLTYGDPLLFVLDSFKNIKVNIWETETTCENQVDVFKKRIEERLKGTGIKLESIKLYETETSFCELKNE